MDEPENRPEDRESSGGQSTQGRSPQDDPSEQRDEMTEPIPQRSGSSPSQSEESPEDEQ